MIPSICSSFSLSLFFEYTTRATLASGKVPNFRPIDCDFFLATTQNGLYSALLGRGIPLYPSDPVRNLQPAFRIMAALGTKQNKKNFYLLEKPVNGMKARVFAPFLRLFMSADVYLSCCVNRFSVTRILLLRISGQPLSMIQLCLG